MDHILKTIETFEAKITEHEREIQKLRNAVNQICTVAGMEPRYQLEGNEVNGTPSVKPVSALKPDEFYGKPLATAARQALNMLRAAGQAPAKPEAIYDVLVQGGFEFSTKVREHALTGLGVSLAKNTEVFVKLPNGLMGLREWYGTPAPRPRRGKELNGSGDRAGDDQVSELPGGAPSQGDDAQQGGATS